MKEMICICCPMGCRMTVEESGGVLTVSGNTCPRGKAYAIDEMTAPKRMVTFSLPVTDGNFATVSVKTASPVPKDRIFAVLAALDGITVAAPVSEGDVIVKNVAGTGVDVIATRTVSHRA